MYNKFDEKCKHLIGKTRRILQQWCDKYGYFVSKLTCESCKRTPEKKESEELMNKIYTKEEWDLLTKEGRTDISVRQVTMVRDNQGSWHDVVVAGFHDTVFTPELKPKICPNCGRKPYPCDCTAQYKPELLSNAYRLDTGYPMEPHCEEKPMSNKCDMKPVKSVRSILEDMANAQRCNYGNPEDYIEMLSIYEAEKRLALLVLAEKKAYTKQNEFSSMIGRDEPEIYGWNSAIEHIAQLIKGGL